MQLEDYAVTYTINIAKDGKDWIATFAELPGCVGVNYNIDDAIESLLDAAKLFLETRRSSDPNKLLNVEFREQLQDILGEDIEIIGFKFSSSEYAFHVEFAVSHEASNAFVAPQELGFVGTVEKFVKKFFSKIVDGQISVKDVWSNFGDSANTHKVYVSASTGRETEILPGL